MFLQFETHGVKIAKKSKEKLKFLRKMINIKISFVAPLKSQHTIFVKVANIWTVEILIARHKISCKRLFKDCCFSRVQYRRKVAPYSYNRKVHREKLVFAKKSDLPILEVHIFRWNYKCKHFLKILWHVSDYVSNCIRQNTVLEFAYKVQISAEAASI